MTEVLKRDLRNVIMIVCCATVAICGEVNGMEKSEEELQLITKPNEFLVQILPVASDEVIPEMRFGKLTLEALKMPTWSCSDSIDLSRLQSELSLIQKGFQAKQSLSKFDIDFTYGSAYWICNSIRESNKTDLGGFCTVFMTYCSFLTNVFNGDFDYEDAFHMAAYDVTSKRYLSVQEDPIMHRLSYNDESLISNQVLINTIGEYLLAYYYEYYRNSEKEFDSEYLFGEVDKLLSTQSPIDSFEEKIKSIIAHNSTLDANWYKKVTNPFLWAFNQSVN